MYLKKIEIFFYTCKLMEVVKYFAYIDATYKL